MGRIVLVTGVSRYLGGRFAQLLQGQPGIDRILAVDVVPPSMDLGGAEFVRADIRNPVVAKVLARAAVDTVVHMNVIATPMGAGGRASMKEINVIGTMQLLAACQQAASVQRLVVKSSGTVYGSSPKDPAMFSEEMEPRALPRSGFAKDSVEVEGYVRGFARRRPDVAVSMFRFANIVGPVVKTPLTSYFALPVVPTPLGYDARLQFVHEDDALEVLRTATVGTVEGTYNVAGDGILLLSQAVRRAGRTALPVPSTIGGPLGRVLRRAGLADFSPEQMTFLRHGRGLDCTRLRERVAVALRHTTVAAFDDFARARGAGSAPAAQIVGLLQDAIGTAPQPGAPAGASTGAPAGAPATGRA